MCANEGERRRWKGWIEMLKRQSDEKIMAVRSLRCLMEKVERGPVGNEQAEMLTELIGYLCRNDMGAKNELSEQRLRSVSYTHLRAHET